MLRLAHRAFDGFDRAFARQIESFRRTRPDVEVEVRVLDVPELYRALVDDGGLRDGAVDIALVLTDWMPALIDGGLIRPLDEHLRRRPPPGWPGDWSESVLSLQTDAAGHVFGLPYHDGPEVLIYRTDLFEDPAERAAFADRYGRPLTPPDSWAEFLEVAEFFHRPDDDLFGCVVAGYPDGHNTVYDFLLQLWARGGAVLDADGRAAFAGAAGVDALNWLRELVVVRQLTQPEPLEYDSVQSGDFFATGRAAMMWNWIGFAVVAELGDSPIRGRIRCRPLPGNSPSLSVYWVLSVSAGCRDPELAYDFIAHAVSPEMDRVTAEAGAVACRLSTWRDPAIRRAFPPYDVMEESHDGARHLPRVAHYPVVNDALGAAIDAVYRDRLTVEEALRQAAERADGGMAR